MEYQTSAIILGAISLLSALTVIAIFAKQAIKIDTRNYNKEVLKWK